MNIQITKNGWTKITQIIKQTNNPYGLLYSASSGGCNGFNFNLEPLTKEIHKKMNNLKFITILQNDESKVYIDPLSELYLSGTEIDYISEDFKNQIYENKFIYNIDKNLMNSCGCGISFSPK